MSETINPDHNLEQKIFVTIDFIGHRLNWFINLHNLQSVNPKSLNIIALSNRGLGCEKDKRFEVTYCASKRDISTLIASMAKQRPDLEFVFLEAEHWIRELIVTKVALKAVVVRPFISQRHTKSFLSFVFKHLAYFYISKKRASKLAYLSTPYMKHYFRPSLWVHDNLTTADLTSKSRVSTNRDKRVRITVPGFQNDRKNPELIIDLANKLEARYPGAYCFQLTGEIKPQTETKLTSQHKDLFDFKVGYLDRPNYLRLLASSDVVLLLYSNRGPSGILIESLCLGVPVAMFQDRIWYGLEKLACGELTLLTKKHSDIEEFLVKSLQSKSKPKQVRSKLFEFELLNHPTGLVNFIFKG